MFLVCRKIYVKASSVISLETMAASHLMSDPTVALEIGVWSKRRWQHS